MTTSIPRRAVTAVFLINGLTLSTYIVRAPSIKSTFRLSDAEFGATGLLFAVAALASMQLVGPLVARAGSRAVLRAMLVVMPVLLAAVAAAPGPWTFAAVATALGAAHGTTDAAMNANAVTVERLAGRPILNGCHAAWSVSAVVASLATALLSHAGVPLSAHLVVAAVVLLVAGLFVTPHLLPQVLEQGSATAARAPLTRPLIVLGLTGTALMVCEGAALGWGGIFLHETRGATLPVAAAAVTAYTAGQTAGRLAGDRLSLRVGAGPLFRSGAALAAAGFAVAVLCGHPYAAVAGFALAGLGTSVLIPLTFSAIGKLPGAATAALVSRFTTFTYAGILLGPALIGWAAQVAGLARTLAALVPMLVVIALLPRPATVPAGSAR
ncbi:MFS transporter [Dactylosporangium sp. CA-139066]|uniref:MFS transporter n=1 Tax=Dactylosporangium sp. CA-139066 TaxID=3239930 RepID=UPI003D8EEEA0